MLGLDFNLFNEAYALMPVCSYALAVTQSFPILLPFGTGDPTCSNCCHPVSLTEAFKHLIKYANVVAKWAI